MNYTKIVLSIVLSTTLVAGQIAFAVEFKDVKSSDWYTPTVMRLVEKGSINGYEDGTFRPQATICRSEFLVMTLGAMDIEVKPLTIEAMAWYTPYYKKAEEIGLLTPGELSENPDGAITRYEMALVVSRVLMVQKEIVDADATQSAYGLKDYGDIPAIYINAVAKAYHVGILSGYPDGTFSGSRPLTRAEASMVVMRILELKH